MIVKEHNHQGRLVLSICDEDLLGKKIEDEKCVLDLTSSFYNGKEETSEKTISMIKKAYIINAVGKNSIGLLKKEELVDDAGIITVRGVPHAQVIFDARR